MSLEDYEGYWRRCDRCWRKREVDDLVEDPVTPGIYVCHDTCADEPGIEESKLLSPRPAESPFKSST